MIILELNDKTFRKEFSGLIQRTKNPTGLLLECGRQLTVTLKQHFQMKDATEPNKLGGRRTHYWNMVATSVQQPEIENPTRISVAISHPTFAQKVFGGTITAKRRQYLTIPLTAQSYGKTAGDFVGAFVLRTANGAFIVKRGESITENGRFKRGSYTRRFFDAAGGVDRTIKIKASLQFLFKLVRSVDQARDPNALPDQTLLEAAIRARGQEFIDDEISAQ
jgi:hypothetical protein